MEGDDEELLAILIPLENYETEPIGVIYLVDYDVLLEPVPLIKNDQLEDDDVNNMQERNNPKGFPADWNQKKWKDGNEKEFRLYVYPSAC